MKFLIEAEEGKATIVGFEGEVEKTLVIPETIDGNTIVGIASDVFANCAPLVTVELPKSIEMLSNRTFKNCCNLKNINLENVTILGDETFAGCSSLEEVHTTKAHYRGNTFDAGTYVIVA